MKMMLDFLNKNPVAAHAATAFLETLVLGLILWALGAPYWAIFTFTVISTFYYGREAGQRDHILEQRKLIDKTLAWYLVLTPFGWGVADRWQWAVPAITSLLVSLILWVLLH